MSISHTFTRKWVSDGAEITKDEIVSAGSEQNIDESIPDSSTDLLVNWTCDYSALKGLFIVSDQDIVLETNDGSSPDNTISLTANVPLLWTAEGYLTNPFTADVTALYVTNASGSAANLKIRSLYDPTP